MSRSGRRWRRAAALVSAAALGALLFSIQVATAVFRDLPGDRIVAGRVAGQAFTSAYGIALAAAVFVLVVVFLAVARRRLGYRLGAAIFVIAAATQSFWIAPAIIRHGTGWPGTFASLHATGGMIHIVLATLALFFAWRLLADESATSEPVAA